MLQHTLGMGVIILSFKHFILPDIKYYRACKGSNFKEGENI